MGFLGKIIKPIVENAFDRWQTEEMENRLKTEDKKVAKMQNLFGPIQNVLHGSGIISTDGWKQAARGMYRKEVEFGIGKLFEPLIADWNAFQGTVENLFAPFYIENREGLVVGETIGGGLGFIAGFFLPGGPAIWAPIFGWLGGLIGMAITGFDLEHPNIPGSPGEIPIPGGEFDYIPHALPDLIPPERVQTALSPVTTEWRIMQTFRVNHYI